MGIQSIFSNILMWPLFGKISSRFSKTLETGSENAPKKDYRGH